MQSTLRKKTSIRTNHVVLFHAFHLARNLAEDLTRLTRREGHLNQQFPAAGHQFKDVKLRLDDLTRKSQASSEAISSLTSELAELDEQLDELKAAFEIGESGGHDASPLLRIKAALKQLKSEISEFDLRTGVVSHSLLTAKHDNIKATRALMMKKNKLKNRKLGNRLGEFGQVFDIDTNE